MSQPLTLEAPRNHVAHEAVEASRPVRLRATAPRLPSRNLDEALTKARGRIAPLWPLKSFVAVNPFLGLSDRRFEDACATMQQVAGESMLMPRAYFRGLIAEGRITRDDLEEAVRAARLAMDADLTVDAVLQAVESEPLYGSTAVTVADVVDRLHGLRASTQSVEEISKWCAAYWDEGQAAWRMPWRHLPLYSAWRCAARLDRAPEVLGFHGFRDAIEMLPEDATAAVEMAVDALGLHGAALDAYLYRLLFSIRGWAAYARYLGWYEELDGRQNEGVIELLAIRLAWDYALFQLFDDQDVRLAWIQAVESMGAELEPEIDADLAVDTVLQSALERAFQRELVGKLTETSDTTRPSPIRPAVQAAFCIDVRSEIFR